MWWVCVASVRDERELEEKRGHDCYFKYTDRQVGSELVAQCHVGGRLLIMQSVGFRLSIAKCFAGMTPLYSVTFSLKYMYLNITVWRICTIFTYLPTCR